MWVLLLNLMKNWKNGQNSAQICVMLIQKYVHLVSVIDCTGYLSFGVAVSGKDCFPINSMISVCINKERDRGILWEIIYDLSINRTRSRERGLNCF